jgi:NADH-quinone oxidoreductase subunit J
MDTITALFYVFCRRAAAAALRVITARSTVHAALFLVLAFFSASCIWMLLRAEFLAITLVLVYVGAVMVLFLFVVMMLDINTDQFRQGFWKHLPLAGFVGALIALEMALVLMRGFQLQAPVAVRQGHRRWATPSCWASRSTRSTCTRCNWRRCCCWWPSSRPLR